ncbi:MAG: hypothetical protein AAF682_24520 [Planctomycetota bacterium]
MKPTFLTALALGLAVMLPQEGRQGPPAPEVGKPAPLIRLNDHEGKGTTVGGEADHWTVLAFYPKAATPG